MTDLSVIRDRCGAVAKLSDTARTLAAASLSANTRRAYAGALKRLDTYIGEETLDDSALAGYLATLFAEGRDADRSPGAAEARRCWVCWAGGRRPGRRRRASAGQASRRR